MKQARWTPSNGAGASQGPRDTVDLLADSFAGVAAAGALGLGLASHSFGMWLGVMTSAAEASQKLFLDAFDARPHPSRRKPAQLNLVETPAPDAAGAVVRTAKADAEIATREMVRTARKTAAAAIDEAAAVTRATTTPRKKMAAPSKPAEMKRPGRPDDLKAISGVGPKLEKVLNDLGIWTYAQVAAFSEAEIAWLDEHLGFSGRIGRDDWTGQAKALAAAGGPASGNSARE